MRIRRGITWWGGAAAVVVACIVACYKPTQVTVDVDTDVTCLSTTPLPKPIKTAFYLGPVLEPASDLVTETTRCTSAGARNEIGSLVFVPRDDRGARVTVHVVMNANGESPSECVRSDKTVPAHCIIARRTFTFAEHEQLPLPVALDRACLGRFCEQGLTCVDGNCLPDAAEERERDGEKKPKGDAGNDADTDADTDASALACATVATDIAALDSASTRLATNDTTLFHLARSASGGVSVVGLPLAGGKGTVYYPNVAAPVRALAADDAQLYIGTTQDLIRVDLATKSVTTHAFPVVLDIALWQGIAFIARATSTEVNATKTLWKHEHPGFPELLMVTSGTPALSGDALASGRDLLFVLQRGDTNGALYAFPLPWNDTVMVKQEPIKGGIDIAVTVPTGSSKTTAYVTTSHSASVPQHTLQRWVPDLPLALHAQGFGRPTQIVADPDGIFHVAAATGGQTVFKTGVSTSPAGLTSSQLENAVYDEIDAIALGPQCVYLSARRTKNGAAQFVIRGIPKTKSAATGDAGSLPGL